MPDKMNKETWQKCWEREGDPPGFHRADIHPFLERYALSEFLAGKRIFVPLCGKSNDLLWLRKHADHVIGIEFVKKPVVEFFSENNLVFTQKAGRFESDKLTLINGDFFDLTREQLGSIDFVYDRASLVALPRDRRLKYLEKMNELTDPSSTTLLITFEHDRSSPNPPFSISPTMVETYYGCNHTIEHLKTVDHTAEKTNSPIEQTFFIEHGFMLTKIT